ncbi:MAG: hypothetical protein HYV35_12145 [Lentisphaerae bacterium]|nr:hypothetical protein [Lentisphaerota bacterium]
MTTISVVDPVNKALGTVRQTLFAPFNLVKWLGLGFTAWLATLTEGFMPNFNFNLDFLPDEVFESSTGRGIIYWIQDHLALVISVGIVLGIMLLAVGLVISWLNCRGKFMFLDNVLNNRAEIRSPWQMFRRQGNALFLFSICFGVAMLAILVIFGLLFFMIAWPDIVRHNFGFNAIGAIVLGGLFLISYCLISVGLLALLNDFIVPLMLLRECRVMTAWAELFELFKAQAGRFVLYLLFRFVLALVISAVAIAACCLLCCTVLIPYVGTVILLPIHVFWRSYSSHFLEQFGDAYRLFGPGPLQFVGAGQERV